MNCSASFPVGRGSRRAETSALITARQEPRPPERGVALVITLILLVVITTLAVAFLALTYRETSSVTGANAGTDADFAADAALERVKAQIKSSFYNRNTNPAAFLRPTEIMGPDLMVSVASTNGTNRLMASGMWTNPTPPVFIQTNRSFTVLDDRFYLDLNRNNRFEPTGYVDDNGNVTFDPANNPNFLWRPGDPQWVGILRDPKQPHGEFNPFIARYAYILLPVGRTLDVNWIHNDSRTNTLGAGFTGYFRNQGVGGYELNLAAFLHDLNPNPNIWDDYQFDSTVTPPRSGRVSFEDAFEILNYRYRGNKLNLPLATNFFGAPAMVNFLSDSVNLFADGPLAAYGDSVATVSLTDGEDWRRPWPGATSLRHYFSIHDFHDTNNLPNFVGRLARASAQANSEDRYTYYRMLAQLGTDAAAERDNRINLNYTNAYFTNFNGAPTFVAVRGGATNQLHWDATNFFHIVADALLTNEFFPYGITNIGLHSGRVIPVYAPTNGSGGGSAFGVPTTTGIAPSVVPLYSPRIHQLLQMAANLYEATLPARLYPTVFRPLFASSNGVDFIAGYKDETGNTGFRTAVDGGSLRWHDLGAASANLGSTPTANVAFYDVPMIFGARKGLPNFNEFAGHSLFQITRKMKVLKNAQGVKIATNHLHILSVSNAFFCEAWNPYAASYPQRLHIYVTNTATASLLKDGAALVPVTNHNLRTTFPVNTGQWNTGATNGTRLVAAGYEPLPPSALYINSQMLVPFNNAMPFENVDEPFTNELRLTISNRFRFFLFDDQGRVVDAFASARLNAQFDVSRELAKRTGFGGSYQFENMFTNSVSTALPNLTLGEAYQFEVSTNLGLANGNHWNNYNEGVFPIATIGNGIQAFWRFLTNTVPDAPEWSTPFNPKRRILHLSSWQANDPVVHYTTYELFEGAITNFGRSIVVPLEGSYTHRTLDLYRVPPMNLPDPKDYGSPYEVNNRYRPWGGQQPDANDTSGDDYHIGERDSGVLGSDYWDFPAQKFPNLGWVGRVHRGTPWQTIYLKAPDPNFSVSAWVKQVGAASYQAQLLPTNDWRMLEVLTAALHPNATRGRLSINQTNAAAWSAVLSGVPVTTVDANNLRFETNVQPMAKNWALAQIHQGITRTRAQLPGGQFVRLSDLMTVPELTIDSPFLTTPPPFDANRHIFRDAETAKATYNSPLRDLDYERIPSQILSLVKVGEPRYVVYAWGQSLKPAEYGVTLGRDANGNPAPVRSGVGIDQGTKTPVNYQITGEVATRAVLRVEFGKDGLGRTDYRNPHAVVESFNLLPNE